MSLWCIYVPDVGTALSLTLSPPACLDLRDHTVEATLMLAKCISATDSLCKLVAELLTVAAGMMVEELRVSRERARERRMERFRWAHETNRDDISGKALRRDEKSLSECCTFGAISSRKNGARRPR